ncbi:MAG: CRISPR-associated protein Cas4 [Mariprofundales bacterium]
MANARFSQLSSWERIEIILEPVLLSSLNQYTYCHRRCALIYVVQVWDENIHTQSGTLEHEQVDVPEHEIKAGVRIERALPVWSDKLGLTGKCDVVEFQPDGTVYPVEYKHGKRKQWDNDDVQLCAQALCLEEMLNIQIEEGAIYHIKSKRRRKVVFNTKLREQVFSTIYSVRDLINDSHIPLPIIAKHCAQCSLHDICMPEANTTNNINIFEPL